MMRSRQSDVGKAGATVSSNSNASRTRKSLSARITAAGDRIAFSWTVREALYRHLSAQVSNGVPVETALDSFRLRLRRRKKVSSDKIVGDIARRMRDGSTFAAAFGQWAPQDEVGVLTSGELSGNLPRSLDLLIDAKRRLARVRQGMKAAIYSPVIYLIMVYAMLWAIGTYVTPGLEQALPKAKARGLIAALFSAGDFATSWWALAPPLIFTLLTAVVVRSLPRWTGRGRIAAETFFPFSFYRDINGYTWLMSFTALLRAGMADVEILKRQSEQASPWLKERLKALHSRMFNGLSLPAALLSRGKDKMPGFGFPNPDVIDDIASMAGFADFPDRISLVAIQWADELETSTLAMAKRFGFYMEIVMYVVMGVLMVAINSMSTQLGNVTG